MQIEDIGFYETRGGKLAYVIGKLPDGANSEYQWLIYYSDNEPCSCTDDGCHYSDREEHEDDLIRHLPTVKSWDDPIPPQELPAVTVYTEWLSVGSSNGRTWVGWTKGDVKPCYAVAKLRTVEVPANG